MSDERIELTLPKMQPKKSSPLLWLAPLVVLVLLLGGGWYWWQGQISDDGARVESGVMSLTAATSGRIGEVAVQLGDTVRAGQVVVKLDAAMLQAQLDEARARMAAVVPGAESSASARAAEQSLLANMEHARQVERQAVREVQQLTSAHAQALLAVRKLDLQRAGEAARNAARLKEIDARVALEQARAAQVEQSQARARADADLNRFRADISRLSRAGLSEETLAQVQEVLGARLREAESRLAAAVTVAPGEGRVSRLAAQPGAFVQAGQPLMDITPVLLRVMAHVTPAQAMRLSVGQAARVSFPDVPAAGTTAAKIVEIFPADENGRVPVRVQLDEGVKETPGRDSLARVQFITFLF